MDNSTTANVDVGLFIRTLIIIWSLLVLSSCATSSRYEVTDGRVTYRSPWGDRPVQGADAATFQPMSEAFARDAKHVYFADKVVVGADPASFSVLDFNTGRDATAIFRASSRCEGCDPSTFRRIDSDWYVDKHAAYASLGDGWLRIEDVDTPSFVVLNKWFAKDNSHVYHNSFRIPGADAASFKLGSCGRCEVCGEDRNRCYWYDRAVPCDCRPHSDADFPASLPVMAPGKARIVSRGFKNAIHVVTVDGVPEKASLNAEVMAGQRVLGLKCPDINGGATGTATLTVKAGRVYMLKPHDGKTCKLELEQYAIVRGRDADPQIRINDLPREPGREVEVNGVFEARLRPGQYTLSVTCLDVRRDAVREAPAMVEIDAKTRYFYELDASFRDTVCDAHVVTSEPL